MLRTYKYRIHPTEDQKKLLASIFGSVRFAYNIALETKKTVYSGYQKNMTAFDLIKQLKELKDNECQWLKDVPSQALQTAILNLDNAYTNFFKNRTRFPKFKNKHSKQSFQLPQGVKLSDDNKQIFIPKLKWVDIYLDRPFKGQIKIVTVSKTVTDKYFVSILVDNYNTVCIEDLAIANMLKNPKLSKAISDMGWSEFRRMLEYKCEWYGKNLIVIGRFEPSSKTCSCCGRIKEDLILADRKWTCSVCNTLHDRDVNAAINIRNIGLKKIKIKTGEDTSEVSAKVDSSHALLTKY